MVKNHLKTLAAPKTWAIKRKSQVFLVRPAPGAHPKDECLPLRIIMADILKYGRTSKEIKYIINNRNVLIDGMRRKSLKFNVGVMDTVQVPDLNEYYRVIFNKKGKIDLVAIGKDEADMKICKIINKSMVSGRTQLNLDDGKNILADKGAKGSYGVGDSLLLHLPDQKILELLKLEKGAAVYLKKGKYAGQTGVVEGIKEDTINIRSEAGSIQTLKAYALVIGKDKPLLTVTK
ncbi:30S ribosomal protein S4e [Candidatus Woesearchaeota archaeon]|nr:30S ribosomal protein S4e [Candidatus Woesearchaeota archaeon]